MAAEQSPASAGLGSPSTMMTVRDERGRGAGTMLMQSLIQRAVEQHKHVMIGLVDADNKPSLRFHERLEFARTAHRRQVGFKFDRWLDLVLVQRNLRVR